MIAGPASRGERMAAVKPLRGGLPRHTLVWPIAEAHARLAAQTRDDEARAALSEWFECARPFVVRRFDSSLARTTDVGDVTVGFPLPPDRGKRRVALTLARGDIACHSAPLTLAHAASELPPPWRASLGALDRDARALGVTLRVFGSAAWQAITGLAYLHDDSDVDILYAPDARAQLDHMFALFERFERTAGRRIDAEIGFAGDVAVAWREWRDARDGSHVLAKARSGVALLARAELLARLPLP
jgi:phosphoribosyl-dephospho-CoA transferase